MIDLTTPRTRMTRYLRRIYVLGLACAAGTGCALRLARLDPSPPRAHAASEIDHLMADRSRRDFLIVGGGLAAANCARALAARGRRRGARSCSSAASRIPPTTARRSPRATCRARSPREDTYFRPSEWWDEQSIELLTRTSVMGSTSPRRPPSSRPRRRSPFGQALLADRLERAPPQRRRLPPRGHPLSARPGNADAIRRDAEDAERVLLIGGSYIGTEGRRVADPCWARSARS